MEPIQQNKHNIIRDTEIKNTRTVTRGEMGGVNGGKRVKGFQEQLQKTHGQNQRGVESGEGGGDAWGLGRGREKRQTTVLEQQQNLEN